MKNDPYNRKISILLPEDLAIRLDRLFERGERNKVMVRVISWMCDKIERFGNEALILFLREDDLGKVVKMGAEEKDGNNS